MKPLLKSFTITKLFGHKDVSLQFDSEYKILVGENGSGKTTILNSLYYTITKNYSKLKDINFESILLCFDKHKIFFTRKEIIAHESRDDTFKEQTFYKLLSQQITPFNYKKYLQIVDSNLPIEDKGDMLSSMLKDKGFNLKASSRYLYQNIHRLLNEYISIDLDARFLPLDMFSSIPIYYFPTYRRVESHINEEPEDIDFDELELDFEEERQRKVARLENLNFGMADVEDLISDLESDISRSTMSGFRQILVNLLSEMAESKKEALHLVNNNMIEVILNRLSNEIPSEDKYKILQYAQSGKTADSHMNFLINQLLRLYESQKEIEEALIHFKDTCNHYLIGKAFVYDESNVDLHIESDYGERLELDVLSSGEMQVIAMFAKLFLSQEKNAIVLLDEPELSLSIDWQEKLLPDFKNSDKCSFLLAVTHSPFIFNNEMKDYTFGLNDFIE